MINEKQDDKIPKFIRLRGCINCDAAKGYNKEQDNSLHESMFLCYVGCEGFNYGISLTHPFLDPEEVVKKVKGKEKELTKKYGVSEEDIIKNTKKYCQHVKEMFGKYYERMGISIDDIAKRLD